MDIQNITNNVKELMGSDDGQINEAKELINNDQDLKEMVAKLYEVMPIEPTGNVVDDFSGAVKFIEEQIDDLDPVSKVIMGTMMEALSPVNELINMLNKGT